MAQPALGDELIENRQVVLVLRLTLDGDAQLLYGELLNAEGIGQGRFLSTSNIGAAVDHWLQRQPDSHAQASDDTTT